MTFYNVDVFFKINDFKKITFDNSVRYVPTSEQTKEKEIEPKKLIHSLGNKTKIFQKRLKNSFKILQQEDLENLQNSICTITINFILLFVYE